MRFRMKQLAGPLNRYHYRLHKNLYTTEEIYTTYSLTHY